jgi:hypothetical protein
MERNIEAVRALLRELGAVPQHHFIVRRIDRARDLSEFLRDVPRATMVRDGRA